MVIAFLANVFSPVLLVLASVQVIRRVAEYAVANPTREMLFTVVDLESRYKAKKHHRHRGLPLRGRSAAWAERVNFGTGS